MNTLLDNTDTNINPIASAALDMLFWLTSVEETEVLSDAESQLYLALFEYLKENDIEIPFGVAI